MEPTLKPFHPAIRWSFIILNVLTGLFNFPLLFLAQKYHWDAVLKWFIRLDYPLYNDQFKYWRNAPAWVIKELYPQGLISWYAALSSPHVTSEIVKSILTHKKGETKKAEYRWPNWDNPTMLTPIMVKTVLEATEADMFVLFPDREMPVDVQQVVAECLKLDTWDTTPVGNLTDPTAIRTLVARLLKDPENSTTKHALLLAIVRNPHTPDDVIREVTQKSVSLKVSYEVYLYKDVGVNNLTVKQIRWICDYRKNQIFRQLEEVEEPPTLSTLWEFYKHFKDPAEFKQLREYIVQARSKENPTTETTWGMVVDEELTRLGYENLDDLPFSWKEELLTATSTR